MDCHEANNLTADCHEANNRTGDCHSQESKLERRLPVANRGTVEIGLPWGYNYCCKPWYWSAVCHKVLKTNNSPRSKIQRNLHDSVANPDPDCTGSRSRFGPGSGSEVTK
jgi:hypothetical protein